MTDTSKYSVGMLFRQVGKLLGQDLIAGQTNPKFTAHSFIESINFIARGLSIDSQLFDRLVIIPPEKDWLRYAKIDQEEVEGRMIRIDMQGQTRVTLDDDDPGCYCWQYELICTGAGQAPDYVGVDAGVQAPDSFPKIYLPAECNILMANYDPTSLKARISGPSAIDNQPTTPAIIDMRIIGHISGDPDNDNYPAAKDINKYFIDPFMIAAMVDCTVTDSNGLTYEGVIPNSADEYLNLTWQEIFKIPTGDTFNGIVNPTFNPATFTIDGGVYTPTAVMNAGGLFFTLTLTEAGGEAFTYAIYLDETPWQTVVQQSNRWGGLFDDENQDTGWYIAIDDLRFPLPDDLNRIKWVWKIPKDANYGDIPIDVDDDVEWKNNADSEHLMYSPMDNATHYFPLPEGSFSREKWAECQLSTPKGYAGWYTQINQQLRVSPKTADPLAILYEAKPDLVDPDTAIGDFDDAYLELPSIAIDCLVLKFVSDYWLSAKGQDNKKGADWLGLYEQAKRELISLFKGRQGQNKDAPVMEQIFYPGREDMYFGGRTRVGQPNRGWSQRKNSSDHGDWYS